MTCESRYSLPTKGRKVVVSPSVVVIYVYAEQLDIVTRRLHELVHRNAFTTIESSQPEPTKWQDKEEPVVVWYSVCDDYCRCIVCDDCVHANPV